MPAKSKSQQRAAGMALAAKNGEMIPDKLQGSARSMYESMTESELEEYAGTKSSGLPNKYNKKSRSYKLLYRK